MDKQERTYEITEVAKRYHRTESTVRRWVRQGRITAINTGGARCGPYIFRQRDLDDFDERSMVGYAAGKAPAPAGE